MSCATSLPFVQLFVGLRRGFVALALTTLAAPAFSADVTVVFNGLRSNTGNLYVAACGEATFLKPRCPHEAKGPAGEPSVVVRGLPAGTYAVQAFHDENGNDDFDRARTGWPLEGLAFSRDAPMRFGPPRFADAAFEVGDAPVRVTVTVRYFP
jgi:uncharacterized protein (DUF2141 family)